MVDFLHDFEVFELVGRARYKTKSYLNNSYVCSKRQLCIADIEERMREPEVIVFFFLRVMRYMYWIGRSIIHAAARGGVSE